MIFEVKPLVLQIPPDLMPIMHYYEGWCVMGCCGLDALDLSPQLAVEGMMDHGLEWAERSLHALDETIRPVRLHRGPVHSGQDGFAHHWPSGDEAAKFLTELRESLSHAVEHVRAKGLVNYPTGASQ